MSKTLSSMNMWIALLVFIQIMKSHDDIKNFLYKIENKKEK